MDEVDAFTALNFNGENPKSLNESLCDTFARSLSKPVASNVLASSIEPITALLSHGATHAIAEKLLTQAQMILPTNALKLLDSPVLALR